MIFNPQDMENLVRMLKKNCPIDTGNLMKNGITGVWVPEGNGFIITIGNKAGVPSTNTYAWFTNYRNKSSLHWVNETVDVWAGMTEAKVNTLITEGNDFNVE